MYGVNKVIIVGRLGADPEVKTVGQNSQHVARMSVATSEVWVDNQGQKQERTEWHRVVLWGKQAENAGKYLKKGRQVYVEGKLQTRSWEDNGQKKYATEIVGGVVQYLGSGDSQGQRQSSGPNDFGPEPGFDTNDEIPF